MPEVAAATGAPPSVFAPDAHLDTLLSSATHGGKVDTTLLATEVARLPHSGQGATLRALGQYLTPLQQGQLQGSYEKVAKDADLPPQYIRGPHGELELEPRYKATVCEGYHKMMDSNQRLSELTGTPFTAGSVAGVTSKPLNGAMSTAAGGALGAMSGLVGLTTLVLGHAPPPKDCK